MTLLYYDARGTPGTDLAQCEALYEVLPGLVVRIPADTPPEQVAAVIAARLTPAQARRAAALGDFPLLAALAGKTDAEIEAWVQANVTDLATARQALVLLARAIGMLARFTALD
jgi:hypothetical protein